MQDRVPVNHGRVLITPENGGAAYYATMTRADNPTQEGTPLNKNTLLTDATAALFGLGSDAVPNDVLNVLSRFQSGMGNEHIWKRSDGAYVNSRNANAYPPSMSDGYTYEYLGQLGDKTRIATGSYVGTGTYGNANPNSLTFEFEPKFVIVSAASGGVSRLMFQSGQTETYQVGFDNGDSINTIVWSGNTVSWYVKNPSDYVNADEQMNQTNMNYIYLAIG